MAKNRGKRSKRDKDGKKINYLKLILISLVISLGILTAFVVFVENVVYNKGEIAHFEEAIKKDNLESVAVKENTRDITYVLKEKEDKKYSRVYNVKVLRDYYLLNPDLFKTLKEKDVNVEVANGVNIGDILFKLIYFSFLFVIVMYFAYSIFGMNRSKLEFVKDEPTRFTDVGGLSEVKKELETIISYLKDKGRLSEYVDKIPKGILFEGDPGNGKTLLARVIAGESNTPFYYISGADIEGSFVAQGAGRVRDVFKKVKLAAEKEGRAILFIDELDSIGTKREKRTVVETNQTINAILTELDGFNENDNILVIGATNLADHLDKALIRSGRFDRIIKIPLPNKNDRIEILELYLKRKKDKISSEIYDLNFLEILSNQTQGFSGSDLSRLVNDALLLAFEDSSNVTITHLREAYLRIVMGLPNTVTLDESDREVIAYHEAAHAVVAMFTSDLGYNAFAYGTIRPYGDSGGHVSLIETERSLLRKSDYFNKVKVLLAGRAIEDKILDGDYTSGASSDLQKVNEILYSYIIQSGMSETNENLFIDNNYGDIKAKWIQDEVKLLRENIYSDVKEIIDSEFDEIKSLANFFLENNDIDYDEINERYSIKYPVSKVNISFE